MIRNLLINFSLLLILLGYYQTQGKQQRRPKLFERMEPKNTGVTFVNTQKERLGHNILESVMFFNGGGVAIGDLNNDGLSDIYLTSNNNSNALYLNKGNFQFQNITEKANVVDSQGWSSGVSMVDINHDGLLDIYVCKSGKKKKSKRKNKLFINNGDLTFTDKAKQYNLDKSGYTSQAVFFDYDSDGDLDVYLVNYSTKRMPKFNIISVRGKFDPNAGDKLLENDNGVFQDVSEESGILQNPIGFGLNATASDLNKDGWPDIYVTNDFIERDYLYINQKDGTFSEEIKSRTTHISYYSMGSDIADFNNDALPDIVTVDMLPDRYKRRRMVMKPNYDNYFNIADKGYHKQNMRNMLQQNNGNGMFNEIGQLAGIDQTDWSWSSLFADFNNDGLKDLYVTNGFPRDRTNLDYLNNILWKQFPNGIEYQDSEKLLELVQKMPKVKLTNHVFVNRGYLKFVEKGKGWGLNKSAVTTGAAYGDLDNDGDLDLVTNNINGPAGLYKNRSREINNNNYLKVKLSGSPKNRFGIGAKIKVIETDGSVQFQEAYPVRGYQSSMDRVLLFGLGDTKKVDIEVTWNDQTKNVQRRITVNQTIEITKTKSIKPGQADKPDKKKFALLNQNKLGIKFKHKKAILIDMLRSPLLPHTLTNSGPAFAYGDVNGDGRNDLFFGGGPGQADILMAQQKNGKYTKIQNPFFDLHKKYQDTDALFFDSDGDDDLDLYVTSGGNSDQTNGSFYQDRLYINNGSGQFTYNSNALPQMNSSSVSVSAADFDNDDDWDLFVGGSVLTGKYPKSPRSFLLENKGGQFTDITSTASRGLLKVGMITDAVWTSINNDGHPDLAVTGEWMPVRIFENNGDKTFTEITKSAGMEKTNGWWNSLKSADLNGDGYEDLIAGNRGLNTSLNATSQNPITLFADDFNEDGRIDLLNTQVINNRRYPIPDRDKLIEQLPDLKKKFPDYSSYANATVKDILSGNQRRTAQQFSAFTLASVIYKNEGDGTYQRFQLPREAQELPIYEICITDYNDDQIPDILIAGNNFGTKGEIGPIASLGVVLIGKGDFKYKAKRAFKTGFQAVGEIRNMDIVQSTLGTFVILVRNGNKPLFYLYRGFTKD